MNGGNFRVIVDGNSSDGFWYHIEDVIEKNGCHPIIRHEPYGIACGHDLKDLKKTLRAMLVACDKPVCVIDSPKLRELPKAEATS